MFKLPEVPQSIFSKMSLLSTENHAINLSQGFPDFDVDSKLVDIIKATSSKKVHQYCPMSGLPELLKETSTLVKNAYGRNLNPEKEILITAGATQGIFATIQALVTPGDEVLILDPSYDCYCMPITLSQGIPIRIPLNHEFLPDWELISQSITNKTKLIITNNPHNPSGRIWTKDDMQTLAKILKRWPQLYHLSDEVYEHITFEKVHLSANLFSALHEKTVVVSSFGKSFHITGWKVGYVVAPEIIMNEIKKVHQYLVFTVNSVSQHALAAYLKNENVKALGSFYQKKRDLFRDGLSKSRFDLLPCEGTYFQLASFKKISTLNDVDFCQELVTKHKVAAIPVSVFCDHEDKNHVVRFCFAKEDKTLINATKVLCKI